MSFHCFNSLTNTPSISIQYQTPSPTFSASLLQTDTSADRCYDQAVASRLPMSEEQLKAFLEKVKTDTSLEEKLKAAPDSDAVLGAKEVGFVISADDWNKAQSEIEDAELESAAGGCQVIRQNSAFLPIASSLMMNKSAFNT